MLGMLQAARRMANAVVSYRMAYTYAEYNRDSLDDITGEGPPHNATIWGRVRTVEQETGEGGAIPARLYQVVINARCGFEPRPGASVTPSCGPFAGVCFTLSGPAMLDAQGANWIAGGIRG